MASGPTLPAHLARLIIERLRDGKVPTDPVLKEVGLTRSQIGDRETRIAYDKHALLLEVAARRLRDPSFGLHLGQSIRVEDFDLLGYICLNSSTLGDVLSNVTRYSRVFLDGFRQTIVQDGDTVTIVEEVSDPKAGGLPQAVEFGLSINQSLTGVLLGYEAKALAFEVPHARVGPVSAYRDVLKAPIRFNAGRTARILPAHLLDAPIRTADHHLLTILKRHAESVLAQRPNGGSLCHSVQSLIASRLQSGEPTIDSVAREMGMSSRTLARRLRGDGVTYRVLLNDLRHQLAVRYLTEGRHTHTETAYLLGFTDVSAFSHAFKRWTGSPPSSYLSA